MPCKPPQVLLRISAVLVLIIGIGWALLAQGQSADQTSSSGVMLVYAAVAPDVSVTAVGTSVDAGTVRSGDFSASMNFDVESNKQDLYFQVDASPMYLGSDPTNAAVNPIPLNLTVGVQIQPQNGGPMSGHSNIAAYQTTPGPVVLGFQTNQTELVHYSSSQNGYFSQNVNVKVTWTLTDPRQPVGEYGGVVQLTAVVMP